MTKQVLTVLVVDDQPEILRALTDVLMRAGHVPITARSDHEAGTMLRSMQIYPLGTDLVLPHGNGPELIMETRLPLRICASSPFPASSKAMPPRRFPVSDTDQLRLAAPRHPRVSAPVTRISAACAGFLPRRCPAAAAA